MKVIKSIITIETLTNNSIVCFIDNGKENNVVKYFPEKGKLIYNVLNSVSEDIINNEIQFCKIMRSALSGNIKAGQTINAVFIENFRFIKDSDFYKKIRIDRRDRSLIITTSDAFLENIPHIYADGSSVGNMKSGFGGFVVFPTGEKTIFQKSFSKGSNNLMELRAVTEGLKILKNFDRICVNTDSRFVIRGLVQWVHFWKHNNWQTAYGTDVRFANEWMTADQLCNGKLIEFYWIKGHSGDKNQSYCHQLARQTIT